MNIRYKNPTDLVNLFVTESSSESASSYWAIFRYDLEKEFEIIRKTSFRLRMGISFIWFIRLVLEYYTHHATQPSSQTNNLTSAFHNKPYLRKMWSKLIMFKGFNLMPSHTGNQHKCHFDPNTLQSFKRQYCFWLNLIILWICMFITESIITNVKPVPGQVELGEMRKGEMVNPVSGRSSYRKQLELGQMRNGEMWNGEMWNLYLAEAVIVGKSSLVSST